MYWDGGISEVLLSPGLSLVFGRGRDCDVPLDDPSVSRAHARLNTGPPLTITDLGSANGTLVEGIAVPRRGTVPLRFGALVELGDAILVVRAPDGSDGGQGATLSERAVPNREELLGVAQRLARSDLSISVHGEPGAGKRHFSEQVHAHSSRASKPFVYLSCAAASEKALARELFGSAAGFPRTNSAAYPGALQQAKGGTLYLDRITTLPKRLQDKLARCLELREVRPLGARAARRINARIIVASEEPLADAVARGQLQTALHRRIANVTVQIPPLRHRLPELPQLVQEALEAVASELSRRPPTLRADVLALLFDHGYPENFRELLQLLRASLLASDEMEIGLEGLPASVRNTLVGKHARRGALKHELEELSRARILGALRDCGGNQTKAAQALGISRRTLVARLDDFAIPRPRKKPQSRG
ncbi:MAG: sigma 54-interacting transcriptional regulator [Polyangiaceae bacterium]